MSVTIDERPNSREFTSGPNPSGVRHYDVHGTYEDTVVEGLVAALAPLRWRNLYRQAMTATPQGTGDEWTVDVPYGPRNREEGESEWSFSISTTQHKITHSLETIQTYVPAGETATDFKQAINVVGDGDEVRVEGVDIPVAEFTWQETLYLPAESFTAEYRTVLKEATGKVNDAAFRIWDPEEVMLQGVSGRPAGDKIELTFQFADQESQAGLEIGGIAGIAKTGWHYLWVTTRDVQDANTERLRPQPQQINIERVIATYDFSKLLIPDPFN